MLFFARLQRGAHATFAAFGSQQRKLSAFVEDQVGHCEVEAVSHPRLQQAITIQAYEACLLGQSIELFQIKVFKDKSWSA